MWLMALVYVLNFAQVVVCRHLMFVVLVDVCLGGDFKLFGMAWGRFFSFKCHRMLRCSTTCVTGGSSTLKSLHIQCTYTPSSLVLRWPEEAFSLPSTLQIRPLQEGKDPIFVGLKQKSCRLSLRYTPGNWKRWFFLFQGAIFRFYV